jgi:hypothetical protein
MVWTRWGAARMVERASPKDLDSSDPICPVCLAPIKPKDKVHGLGDDLTHEACDYMRPESSKQAPTRPAH